MLGVSELHVDKRRKRLCIAAVPTRVCWQKRLRYAETSVDIEKITARSIARKNFAIYTTTVATGTILAVEVECDRLQ